MSRACVIGLDCLSPELVFECFRGLLPNLERLMQEGLAGPMESCIPPITVPAWAAMMTGTDPGCLGLYGFRDRQSWSYGSARTASSLSYYGTPLWEILSQQGRRSRIIGVPPTYPPKPLRGAMVSCLLTPTNAPSFTYPPEIAGEVERITGGYCFDVQDHRSLDPDQLLAALYDMTERRFRLARDWIRRGDWDLFVLVEIAVDRLHHAFWPPPQPPGQPLRPSSILRDFYMAVDAHVGTLLHELHDTDVVVVASDHGAQACHGSMAINDWLRQAGYLALRREPTEPQSLQPEIVDWSRTRVWAEGGYVGRLFVNMRGREPEGLVAPDQAAALLAGLGRELEQLAGPGQEKLTTRVWWPGEIYHEVRGIAPDALVCFDDLRYRVVGTIGHAHVYLHANDGGRDLANHSPAGVLILRDGRGLRPPPPALSLYDVAPTLLHHLSIGVPSRMRGRILA